MFQEFYSQYAQSDLMLLPLFAMGLFLLAFGAILYWVLVILRDSPLPEYMANLPLSDDPSLEGRQEASSDEQ